MLQRDIVEMVEMVWMICLGLKPQTPVKIVEMGEISVGVMTDLAAANQSGNSGNFPPPPPQN